MSKINYSIILTIIICFVISCDTTRGLSSSTVEVQTPTVTIPATFTPIPPAGTVTALTTPISTATIPSLITPKSLGEADNYQLKRWTEIEAVSTITEAKTILTDTHYSLDTQRYLINMEQEALLRFPALENRTELEWDLVSREATYLSNYPFDEYPTQRLAELLGEALQSGQVQPDILEMWLEQRGFIIVARETAFNLFNNGNSVEVLHITAKNYLTKHSILAVITLPTGDNQVVPLLEDRWLPFEKDTWTVSLGDHNNNGQPEIVSVMVNYQEFTCNSELKLYEWQGNYPAGQFINITHGTSLKWYPDYNNCEGIWSFGPANAAGIQSIIETIKFRNWGGETCLPYQHRIIYSWVGSRYQRTDLEREAFDPSQPIACAVGWANAAVKDGQYTQAIPLLIMALGTWSTDLNAIWGSNAHDYFQLKLGIWYASQGEVDLAKTTLQAVRDHPTNPSLDLISEIARVYLENYENKDDLHIACGAVLALLKEIEPADAGYFGLGEEIEKRGGVFEPVWNYHPATLDDICEFSIERSVHLLGLENRDQFVNWLTTKGFSISATEPADLTGDGVDNWLINAKLEDKDVWELWALIQENPLRVVRISTLQSLKESSFTKLEAFRLSSDSSYINILQVGDQLIAFRITPTASDGLRAEILLREQNVLDFEIKPSDNQINLMTLQSEESITYFWDENAQYFQIQTGANSSEVLSEAIELVEQKLFNSGSALEVMELLQHQFTDQLITDTTGGVDDRLRRSIQAHRLYLLGLAYELSGDEENAAHTYWQLWQNYPQSPYSLVAQRKLEPR